MCVYFCNQKGDNTIYHVPLTTFEMWIVIAIFAVIAIVATARKRHFDDEWKEQMNRKDEEIAEFKEFFAEYKKQHPEIWNENGELHSSSKATD